MFNTSMTMDYIVWGLPYSTAMKMLKINIFRLNPERAQAKGPDTSPLAIKINNFLETTGFKKARKQWQAKQN